MSRFKLVIDFVTQGVGRMTYSMAKGNAAGLMAQCMMELGGRAGGEKIIAYY